MADESCTTCGPQDSQDQSVSFEDAMAAYADQKYWVSFFIRPCCPAPNGETAKKQLDKQRDMVRAREDFTEEQKTQLLACIDEGEAWYRKTPYWGKA